MKIQSQDLQKAVARVVGLSNGRATLPILSHALIKQEKEGISIATTNLDAYAKAYCAMTPTQPEPEEAFCIPCDKLIIFANAVDGEIELTHKDGWATLKTEDTTAKLPTLKADEFVPEPAGLVEIGVNCEDLAKAIKAVAWAAAVKDNEGRPMTIAVNLETGKDFLRAQTFCGKLLARQEIKSICGKSLSNFDAAYASELIEILGEDDPSWSAAENWVKASSKAGYFAARQIEGAFYNVGQVLDQKWKPVGDIDHETISDAMALAERMVSDADNYAKLRFDFGPDGILIKADNGKEFSRFIKGKFSQAIFGINATLFLKMLTATHEDKLSLALDMLDVPCALKITAGDCVSCIALMRINLPAAEVAKA